MERRCARSPPTPEARDGAAQSAGEAKGGADGTAERASDTSEYTREYIKCQPSGIRVAKCRIMQYNLSNNDMLVTQMLELQCHSGGAAGVAGGPRTAWGQRHGLVWTRIGMSPLGRVRGGAQGVAVPSAAAGLM